MLPCPCQAIWWRGRRLRASLTPLDVMSWSAPYLPARGRCKGDTGWHSPLDATVPPGPGDQSSRGALYGVLVILCVRVSSGLISGTGNRDPCRGWRDR